MDYSVCFLARLHGILPGMRWCHSVGMRWCQSCSSSTSRGSEVDCRLGLPYMWRHEKSRGWTSEWVREGERGGATEMERVGEQGEGGRDGGRGKMSQIPMVFIREWNQESIDCSQMCNWQDGEHRERFNQRIFTGLWGNLTEEDIQVVLWDKYWRNRRSLFPEGLDSVWTCPREMYLYKATCPDIPTPKQKGLQKERAQSRCGKQNAGGKLYPPLVCLRSKSQVELKHLEEFLNVHTLSLQDSVRARTGMAYRYTHTQ